MAATSKEAVKRNPGDHRGGRVTSRRAAMSAILKGIIGCNRRLSGAIEPFLPQAREDIFLLYERKVGERMRTPGIKVIADVGGGKACPFASYRDAGSGARIIAVDWSEEEMRENRDVDEKIVADITRGLPFPDGSVDMITSRSVLEHLLDIEAFVAESRRALREGGYFVHLFPCRFAPFALINRLLPDRIARGLLFSLIPEARAKGGFPALYRDCYYSAMQRILKENGFEIEELIASYYQSPYFGFFLPLYILSAAYEMLVRALGARDLCAYLLVVARKSACRESGASRAGKRSDP